MPGTIESMQNTDRWRSHQFQPTHIWNPWSNETDANLEDSACTVLLFFPITDCIGFNLVFSGNQKMVFKLLMKSAKIYRDTFFHYIFLISSIV